MDRSGVVDSGGQEEKEAVDKFGEGYLPPLGPDKKAEKKKPKGSGKGGSGERAVARMLTKWITGKPTPEVLWRSAMSGGKATLDGVKRHTMAGDFVMIDLRAKFLIDAAVIDVKNRKTANALDFLPILPEDVDCLKVSKGAKTKGKKSWKDTLYCWWIKLLAEANEAEKIPILIFKRYKSKRWYIVFTAHDWSKFGVIRPVIAAVTTAFNCVVVNMDDFMSNVSPSKFKEAFPVEMIEKFERVRSFRGRTL